MQRTWQAEPLIYRLGISKEGKLKHQKAWVIFFWIVLFLFALDIFQEIRGLPNTTPGGFLIYCIRVISFIGLYGFVYQKKIGRLLLWRAFLVLHSFLIYKIITSLYITSTTVDINFLIFIVVAAIIFFIYGSIYYSNFKYAFRSWDIWKILPNNSIRKSKGRS